MIAHNYHLEAVFKNVSELLEPDLDLKIQNTLIKKINSCDLGKDVDFLKGVSLSDTALLKVFWTILAKIAKPATVVSLSLERDRHTRWTLMGPP